MLQEELQLTPEIEKVRRLGGKKEGKNRPVLVVFRRYEEKVEVLKRKKQMKRKIFINPDLTPRQYERERRLVKKMKEARARNQRAYIKQGRLYIDGAVTSE